MTLLNNLKVKKGDESEQDWIHCEGSKILLTQATSLPTAPLAPHHAIQQACGQQACGPDACLSHAAPSFPPWHPTHHHQLGAPGTPEDPQALEPQLPAACASPAALSCSLLQGGEASRVQHSIVHTGGSAAGTLSVCDL